jgi:hypothetical protein
MAKPGNGCLAMINNQFEELEELWVNVAQFRLES